jgi:SAM-dependent methyltransferase
VNQPYSKFALVEDVRTPEFQSINRDMNSLSTRFDLSDHTDLNAERYPWSEGLLDKPAFYAARLWEYPFAIQAADLLPGMKVADIGCGMTAFTIYLKDFAECDVTGIDPDIFDEGTKYFAHGVSQEFIKRTGLRVLKGDFEAIPLETNSQDRVFSISVMEHVAPEIRRRGIQEIARILKPGGRAVITVDVSMVGFELNRPLDLIWDSGLTLVEPIDLRWPTRRFGMFSESKLPADVFGMTLVKENRKVEIQYRYNDEKVETIEAHRVPTLIPRPSVTERPLWRRVGGRLKREIRRIV